MGINFGKITDFKITGKTVNSNMKTSMSDADVQKGDILKNPLSGTRDGMFSPEVTRQIGLPSTIVTPGISFLAGIDRTLTFVQNFYITVQVLTKKFDRVKSSLKPFWDKNDKEDAYNGEYTLDSIHKRIARIK